MAIVLAIAGLLTVIYPILSLPCSVTGFFQASSAMKFIKTNDLKSDTVVNVVYFLTIVSMLITTALVVYAFSIAFSLGLLG